jgi:polysaccharide biosynthesis protein PslH
MNILWFSHLVPYPPTGLGVLQRSYNLVRELARVHRVHLLAFVQNAPLRDLLGDVDAGLTRAREHLGSFCERVEFLPIPAERRRHGQARLALQSLFTPDPYSINWLKSGEARTVAEEWNRRVDFEVVHFDTLSLAPYLDIFANRTTSLDHHNIESHMMLRRADIEKHPLRRLYYRQEGIRLLSYEKRLCPRFDLNITCSALDTERLLKALPGLNIAEIPNGVDTDYFKPFDNDQVGEEPLSMVFAGNMSWYPNAAAMLFFAEQVWPKLKVALPGAKMHVVGANAPAALTELGQRDPHFKVHGFVPDARDVIGPAALYVCPIMDGGGTKLKVLDALAMGKPLVAHPVACEGIDVRDGENVVFATDPQQFVAKIVSLLGDPVCRDAMSAAARSLAEARYSYASIGTKLATDLERCHEETASRRRAR